MSKHHVRVLLEDTLQLRCPTDMISLVIVYGWLASRLHLSSVHSRRCPVKTREHTLHFHLFSLFFQILAPGCLLRTTWTLVQLALLCEHHWRDWGLGGNAFILVHRRDLVVLTCFWVSVVYYIPLSLNLVLLLEDANSIFDLQMVVKVDSGWNIEISFLEVIKGHHPLQVVVVRAGRTWLLIVQGFQPWR